MLTSTRRSWRLVHLVSAMKRGEYPNAQAMARHLARAGESRNKVGARTLQRDIQYLQLKLDAPIDYDATRHGYFLADPNWSLPLGELEGDHLYASLLGETLSLAVLPSPLRYCLEEVLRAQLTAADPDEIDPEVLRAVVFATGATAELAPAVFEIVHQAWRERRRLSLTYATEHSGAVERRDVDVHALFLAQGAWYARVHCHLRRATRSLALHRIRDPELLETRFVRSETIIAGMRTGNVFDYEMVRNVVLECSQEKARLIAEREWFPGQKTEPLPDGGLRLRFPAAPRPELVYWVMSYCGHLIVRSPPDLREEVRRAAEVLARDHSEERKSKEV